jgi:hypothetical protein
MKFNHRDSHEVETQRYTALPTDPHAAADMLLALARASSIPPT